MRFFRFLICIFLLTAPVASCTARMTDVHLEDYGDVNTPEVAGETFIKALNDISGKRLLLPPVLIRLTDDFTLKDCWNFEIVGNPAGGHLECKIFMLLDCRDFAVDGMSFYGTKEQFASFYVIGDCKNFEIRGCRCDSEKDDAGNNTFYGIHVCGRADDPNASYADSPRNFKIHDNVVRNTRYDGILVHGHCSDFIIEKNTVVAPQCIGIEVEGRFGDLHTTTVHRCRRGVVRDNYITDCGDWGILLMWSDGITVTRNESRNAFGTFLSIGCTDLKVTRNILEGTQKGFEISQEFFAIEKGINRMIRIRNNEITCAARSSGRGAVDIRHSENVDFRNNTVKLIYKPQSSAVSVCSSVDVTMVDNDFRTIGEELPETVSFADVTDPETGGEVPELSVRDVRITRNKFTGQTEKIKMQPGLSGDRITFRNTFN
ncbi:MAG: right-handed parallel beta-helix repeat-containing protein [Bacteroidales bacterium]|nr:right-handed parallel beta-helix repeat-containing protein [Bacteroidales bacterium]